MRKNRLIALIGTLTMAAAGLAAVSAGVSGKKAEPVNANNTTVTVYCAISPNSLKNLTLKVNAQVGTGDWTGATMTAMNKTYHGKPVYKGQFTEKYGGVDTLQFQIYDGSTFKEQVEPYSSWTTADQFNNKLFAYGETGWRTVEYDDWYLPGTFDGVGKWGTENQIIYDSYDGTNKYAQYKIDNVCFSAGDTFKFKESLTNTWISYGGLTLENFSDYFEDDGSNDHNYKVKANKNLKAKIYLKICDSTRKVWFEEKLSTLTVSSNDNNMGTVTASKTADISYKENVTLTASAKAGYHFVQWNDENTNASRTVSVTESATYSATFAANTNTPYIVNHNQESLSGGGFTTVDTDNLTGTTGANTAATAKSYEGFTAPSITQQPIAGDGSTVINLNYTRNSHTLSWVTDGDPLTGDYTSGSVKYGTTIVEPNTPEKSGYTFSGWSATVPETMPDNDLSFTATWTEVTIEYNIDFMSEDGETLLQSKKVAKGFNPTYTGTTPTKTSTAQYSYEHDGWSTTVGGEKLASLPAATTDATYYAHFKATTRSYDIYFKSEDGQTTLETLEDVLYNNVPSPTVSPTKSPTATEVFTFDGWSATVGGAKLDSIPAVTGSTSYYAHFSSSEREYTINFSKGSGTGGTSSISVTYNQQLPQITVPTAPENQKFEGYYTAASGQGTKYYDLNGNSTLSYTDTSVSTLYAYYKQATSATIGVKSGTTFYIRLEDATAFWNTAGAKISVNFMNPVGGFLNDNVWSAQFTQVGDNAKLLSATVPQLNGEDVYWSYAQAVRFNSSATEFKWDDNIIWNQCQPTGDDPAQYMNGIHIYAHTDGGQKYSTGEWFMYTDAGVASRKGFYIKPNSSWLEAEASFKVEFSNPIGKSPTKIMTDKAILIENSDGIYEVKIPQLDSADVEWGTVQVFRYSKDGNTFYNKTQEFMYNGTNKDRQYVEITDWNEGSLKDSFTDVDRADLFGVLFLEKCAVCDKDGKVLNITSTIWGDCASAYSAMADYAQGEFWKATANEESTAGRERAAASYDYIVGKYSKSVDYITDFAGREPSDLGSGSRLISINDVTPVTWIIASVAIVGIAAVGVFFIYRKRKEN